MDVEGQVSCVASFTLSFFHAKLLMCLGREFPWHRRQGSCGVTQRASISLTLRAIPYQRADNPSLS